jgi:hypothetical protein
MSPAPALAIAIALTSLSLPVAAAGGSTKEECLDAHGRGQDQRERGQLVRAKQTFTTCAQSACPTIVQNDCARLVEELSHVVPTVTFAARDATAADLPNTFVYVDDALLATRLDDGKAYEVDPGRHLVRYVHEGRETSLRVVVNQGEKGRVLLGTFVDPSAPSPRDTKEAAHVELAPVAKRPVLPLFVAGAGALAAITGTVLYGVGMSKVPSSCSVSSHECAAPPGDPTFDQARSGIGTANVGIATAVTGLVVLASGLVWYFVQPSRADAAGRAPTPFLSF